jgi:hypothetical protein
MIAPIAFATAAFASVLLFAAAAPAVLEDTATAATDIIIGVGDFFFDTAYFPFFAAL